MSTTFSLVLLLLGKPNGENEAVEYKGHSKTFLIITANSCLLVDIEQKCVFHFKENNGQNETDGVSSALKEAAFLV